AFEDETPPPPAEAEPAAPSFDLPVPAFAAGVEPALFAPAPPSSAPAAGEELPAPEPDLDRAPAAAAEPPLAAAEPAALDTASLLAALDDPDTRELVVIAGRRPRVRTSSGWTELHGEVSEEGWIALWRAISARTGAPAAPPPGHIAHLGPRGVVVEAMMPPLSDEAVLHLRRRPPEASLEEWIAAGRVDGNADALRDAVLNRRGVLVVGDRATGRTSFLEALATSTSPGERVAACERLPQLRIPGALRVRLDPSNPDPALSAARAVMAEWLVLDDAAPTAVGAAALDAEANRAALLVSARAVDAETWLLQVARSISYEVPDAPDFVRSVLGVVVRVELGPDGRPRARVERS
ncbi:MAG TPA: hypothetical protein VFO60_09100, partial [Candidatus Dormibacteraeota bacterium]|nr:hypothetical protein [Candidatus Dormibacteraeota bacterium]